MEAEWLTVQSIAMFSMIWTSFFILMGDSTKRGGFSAKMFKPINTVVHLIMVHPAEFPSRGYFINVLYCLIVVKHGGSSMLTARKGGRKTFTKER